MKPIIALFILLLLNACAQPPTAPDWLAGEAAAYSSSRYLLGRGQAASVGLARDRARADLAKTFAVKIREQSSDQLLWQQGGEERLQGLQTTISREIQARTEQLIEGVQIAATWHAETGGDYHVLAVLDRLQAGHRLRSKINQLDAETAQQIERARDEETLPQQIAAARAALLAQLQRQHEQQLLSIVDVTGTGIAAKYQLAELKSDFDQLLDRWRIAPQAGQDDLGGLQQLLAGALGNAGVLHAATAAEADYLLRADVAVEKFVASGWHWQRGVLEVTLQQPHSGRVFGSHQWPFKVSSKQAETATIRARSYLGEVLDRELLEVLTAFGDAGDVAQ